MLTYYCPNCWEIIQKTDEVCPHCNYHLDDFSSAEFEEKLLQALHHSLPERRIMAAQILGNRGSQRAIDEFLKILQSDEMDYFFLRAVLLATAKINNPMKNKILDIAAKHSSELVSNFVKKLQLKLTQGKPIRRWDRNLG